MADTVQSFVAKHMHATVCLHGISLYGDQASSCILAAARSEVEEYCCWHASATAAVQGSLCIGVTDGTAAAGAWYRNALCIAC